MGESRNMLAAGLSAMGNLSMAKLDYPRHCKYRSGQCVDDGKRVWVSDKDNPNRRFKVWLCSKFNRRVIWRDCRDNDSKLGCAEAEDVN